MAKTKISEYDATAANNTDIDSINIAEGMLPSNVNNAFRELMAHLKDMDAGTHALTSPQFTSVDINGGTADNVVIGGTTAAAGTFTTLTANTSITGTLATAAQTNITSVGTLTSLTVSGDVSFGDNDKAIFGAGSDLEIYSDGTTGQIVGDVNITGTLTSDGLTVDTNTLHVDASNNRVGIGTSSPDAKIKIQNDNSTVPSLTIRDGGTPAANMVHISSNATGNNFVINSSGNVGIGTSSPAAPLEVSTSSADYRIQLTHASGQNKIKSLDGDQSTFRNLIYDAAQHMFETSGSEAMRIDSSGNVGIGATPEVVSGYTTIQAQGSSQGGIFTSTTSSGDKARFYVTTTAGYAGTVSNQDFIFLTNDTERMRIDSSGNVGIGVTDPVGRLEVKNSGDDNGFEFLPAYSSNINLMNSYNRNASTYYPLENRASYFMFKNGTSEAMRIDSSGNVGIGQTPTNRFDVTSSAIVVSKFKSSAGGSGARAIHSLSGNGNSVDGLVFISCGSTSTVEGGANAATIRNSENAPLIFGTNNTERMRIDSSGNLLVGKTSTNTINTVGHDLTDHGEVMHTTDGGTTMYLNRKTSDGTIVDFRKDGTTVGSIGVGGSDIYHGSGDTGLKYYATGDAIHPYDPSTLANRDNAIDLGMTSIRFDDIYATNGTIQTSDRNEKQDIAELSDAEQRVAVACKGLLRKFRWRDAVAEKGDEARTHFGIIAQDLQAAFAAEGLDAGDYAMFIYSTWTDEETGEERTRMGVRYSELLAFIIAAI